MVSGLIGGAHIKLLWDTGSEVSIVSQDWVEANLPDHEIKNISEILEEGRELTLRAANRTDIPYIGYIEASFELKDSACPITVPFLVTEEDFDPFILGYNVIELIVAERSNAKHKGKVRFLQSFQSPSQICHLEIFMHLSILSKHRKMESSVT